jgi:hypothetical protein
MASVRKREGDMSIRPQLKPRTVRDERRLQFVREMDCLIEYSWPSQREAFLQHVAEAAHAQVISNIDAHHVYDGKSGGIGMKPSDFQTVPLCQAAHEEFHRIGKQSFEAKYGLDLEAHIKRINEEFKKKYPKEVGKREIPRRRTPKATVKISHCSCGKSHELPIGKTSLYFASEMNKVIPSRLVFRCPTSNQETEAKV